MHLESHPPHNLEAARDRALTALMAITSSPELSKLPPEKKALVDSEGQILKSFIIDACREKKKFDTSQAITAIMEASSGILTNEKDILLGKLNELQNFLE